MSKKIKKKKKLVKKLNPLPSLPTATVKKPTPTFRHWKPSQLSFHSSESVNVKVSP